MDLQLAGKTALVTGASKGIGLAIAKMLAHEGVITYISGRSQANLDAAKVKILENSLHAKVETIVFDFDKDNDYSVFLNKLDHVDILVNNVGFFDKHDFFTLPDEAWLRYFNLNIMSGVKLSRIYLKKMLKNNFGRIIFISSEAGIRPMGPGIAYSMTKTAQLSISKYLSELTKGTKVTVNAVLPGPTLTEGVADYAKEKNIKEAELVEESSLIQRVSDPKEVAYAVTMLASPLSSSMNGTTVKTEGGLIKTVI